MWSVHVIKLPKKWVQQQLLIVPRSSSTYFNVASTKPQPHQHQHQRASTTTTTLMTTTTATTTTTNDGKSASFFPLFFTNDYFLRLGTKQPPQTGSQTSNADQSESSSHREGSNDHQICHTITQKRPKSPRCVETAVTAASAAGLYEGSRPSRLEPRIGMFFSFFFLV
jgi:hypothetical protein